MSYVEHLGTSRHYVILYKLPKKYLFLFERLGSPTGSSTRPHARYKAATATGIDGGGGDISAGADGGGNGDGGGGGLSVADNRKGGPH